MVSCPSAKSQATVFSSGTRGTVRLVVEIAQVDYAEEIRSPLSL